MDVILSSTYATIIGKEEDRLVAMILTCGSILLEENGAVGPDGH